MADATRSSAPTVLLTAEFDHDAAAPLRGRARLRWEGPLADDRPIEQVLDREALADADALVVELAAVGAAALEAAPRLDLIVTCRGTPANVDLEACARRGVAVRTTPGRNAQATADLTLALILDAVRRTSASQQWLRSGSWTARDQYLPYELFRGPQLSDLTLGIVGLGRVGVEVAHRALGFGMRVLAHGPHLTPAGAPDGVEATGLPDLLRRSDVISLHAPARPDTRGLIGAVEIARMRRGAVLVNTARASLIDEDAVVDALRTGHLGAAAFDVFWREPLPPGHPLLRLPQVVLTPHIGGASDSVVRNHSRAAVDHLLSWLGGRTA